MTHMNKFFLFISVICLTLLSGFILNRTGRPYSTLYYNIHKLISLGAVILMVVISRFLIHSGGATAFLWGIISLSAAAIAVLFVTGALLSIQSEPSQWVFIAHRWAPVCVTLTSLALLLLFRLEIFQGS